MDFRPELPLAHDADSSSDRISDVGQEQEPRSQDSRPDLSKIDDGPSTQQTTIADLKAKLASCEAQLAVANTTLATIFDSKTWKLMSALQNLKVRFRRNPVLRLAAGLGMVVINSSSPHRSYQKWITTREAPTLNRDDALKAIARFTYRPKISIIMPVYNTPEKLLRRAIESVLAQYYDNWELCVCDDASSDAGLRSLLQNWAQHDPRIHVVFSKENTGIAGASNQALRLATGEFVGFLDHDDELSPSALYEVARLLQDHADADMIYSDEDKLGLGGRRDQPFFKPDWSPEYLLSCMYTCHFGVYRKALVDSIGGFREDFDGSQDYDLVLRMSEKTNRIYHIPKVLYHWRMTRFSTAQSGAVKPHAFTAARRALGEHLQRRQVRAVVHDGRQPGHYRIRFEADPQSKISIIIPTRDNVRMLSRCIRSIESKTQWRNYEVVVVDNQSFNSETKNYLSSLSHKVLPFPEAFNFSRILNHAVKECAGDYLLFLNDDTEVISPDWLGVMLGICQQKEIGVVGAKLLYRDHRIQHVGVVLGLGGPAGHVLRGFSRHTWRQFGIASDMRNCSAVTAACMMVRRDVFEEVQGFDETLAVAYNDVDFCLRVREAGYRIVVTPDAELYHHESVSRGYAIDAAEVARFQKRWGTLLANDPYYNPNLTLQHEDFGYRI